MGTVIGALLPLIVTLGLGFFAAWRHQFSAQQASVLNKMVLLYAVPLLLFAVTVTIKRDQLTADLGVAAAVAVAMLASYLLTYLITHLGLGRSRGLSALTALAVGGPAVPFAGIVVLGYLYGAKLSAPPIAIGSLVLNVIEVPVTLLLLSLDAPPATPANAPTPRALTVAQVATPPQTAVVTPALVAVGGRGTRTIAEPQGAVDGSDSPLEPSQEARSGAHPVRLAQHLIDTAKQPVVWAPVLALVLVLAGLGLPQTVVHAMTLLGSASTGVALFAGGIVLYAQRIAVTRFVIGTVVARNVIVPAVLWAVLAGIGMPHASLRLAVLTLALPAPVACVIFAVRYDQGQRETASIVLFSSVGSLVTLAAFITLT
jgi:malonate transporter and related proteins